MKKKLIAFIIVWAVAIPALAGGAIMLLWNWLMPNVAEAAPIGFLQSAGLFLLGQVLSGGFIFGLLLLAIGGHVICFHHNHRSMERWRRMSPEQRRAAMSKRMAGFRNMRYAGGNAGDEPEKEDHKRAGGDGGGE